MKLTMKNYKGYHKLPYCHAHYPTTKFTSVADTPENLRLTKQQQNVSMVVYQKGKQDALKEFTQVSDSVATKQALHSGSIASDLRYQTMPFEVGREGKEIGEIVNRPKEGEETLVSKTPAPVSATTVQQPPAPTPPKEPEVAPASTDIDEDATPVVETPAPAAPKAPAPPAAEPPKPKVKPEYVAIYDYHKGDDDEITILEGDFLVETSSIDEGWSEGKNVRTGLYGMFPSNYVQAV